MNDLEKSRDNLADMIHSNIMRKVGLGVSLVAFIMAIAFFVTACCADPQLEDPEMMEHNSINGLYECVLMAGGGAYCR